MVPVKRVLFGTLAAAAFLVLVGCPSPFLAAIKQAVANAPFTATSYTFVRDWGNAAPQYSFMPTMQVKTDPAGYIYVADSSFRIRKFTSSGTLVKVFNLISSQGLFGSIYDMAFDASGNMYVTNSVPQVQMYDVNGNFVRQWGSSTNFSSPYGITVDSSGNIYVVDGGKNNVQLFNSAGTATATWSGTTPFGGTALSGARGIVTDGAYVYIVDTSNSRVVKVTAGTGGGTFSASWGGATTYGGVALSSPYGISIDGGGHVYVADTNNSTRNRVVVTGTTGTFVGEWGTTGTSNGAFTNPNSIALDTGGAAYVADQPSSGGAGGRVQRFTLTFTPSWGATWSSTWGGPPPATNGLVNFPEGIAFDPSGNLYVVDTKNDRIQKFGPTGNFLLAWGSNGTGNGQFSLSNGGSFGIAVDAARNRVYVSDSDYYPGAGSYYGRVQEFDTSGNFIRVVAAPGTGNLQVNNPEAVTVDSAGNVYIADSGNTRVQVIDPNGYWVRNFGSASTSTYPNPPLDGQFFIVADVAVDSAGNAYVADPFSNRVSKFDASGNFVLKMDASGSGNAQFALPFCVAVDKMDNFYVADLGNRRFQKFDSSGRFLTAYGTPGIGNGGIGYAVGVAVDSKGNVAVSDLANNQILEFAPAF